MIIVGRNPRVGAGPVGAHDVSISQQVAGGVWSSAPTPKPQTDPPVAVALHIQEDYDYICGDSRLKARTQRFDHIHFLYCLPILAQNMLRSHNHRNLHRTAGENRVDPESDLHAKDTDLTAGPGALAGK